MLGSLLVKVFILPKQQTQSYQFTADCWRSRDMYLNSVSKLYIPCAKKVLPSWSVFQRFLFAVWLARFFFNVNAADRRLFTIPNNLFYFKIYVQWINLWSFSLSLCIPNNLFFTDYVQLIHDLSSLVCSCSHSSSRPLTRAWTWLPRTWEWIPTCRSSSDPARKSQPETWRIAFDKGRKS